MKAFIFLSFTAVAFSVQCQVAPILASNYQNIIEQALINPGVKGISACVILPDETIWLGTAGDNGSGIEINENTVFYAGSTTKSFVATRVLQLWQEDAIDLDAPYTSYIDEIPNVQPEVTIRQLLGHTSGVYDYIENPIFFDGVFSDFSYTYDPIELLSLYLNQPHNFQPGTNYQYSNTNYIILGLVIEGITGNSLAQELRDNIFNPLLLTKTYFGGYETFNDQHCGLHWLENNSLVDLTPNFPHQSLLTCAFASGNIVSYPQDEAKYVRKLMNGEVLNDEALAMMLDLNTFSNNYGLGAIAIPAGGDTVLYGHTGGIGNITEMFHCPLLNVTVVVVQNSMNASLETFINLFLATTEYLNQEVSVEEAEVNELSIFPNPASNLFTVTHKGERMVRVDVIGINGNLIKTMSPNANIQDIDLSELAVGIYNIQVLLDSGHTINKQLQKR